jgi:hypothetical protein
LPVKILPRAGGAGHVGLSAEAAFHAHFAGHCRHLVGKRGQRVGHVVDGLGQRGHFALGVHRELLREFAVGDRGHHLHDAAHLFGQVGGHHVDVVGKILPRAGHAGHLRLAAQLAFGSHFAGHARHFGGEGVELVHHGVDGVLQLQNFALHVDRDLARQVAAATAVVTSAMLLTCAVRLPAIAFTESVRSFHVPATPGTLACPPSRPSCPLRAPRASLRRRTSAAARPWCSAFL